MPTRLQARVRSLRCGPDLQSGNEAVYDGMSGWIEHASQRTLCVRSGLPLGVQQLVWLPLRLWRRPVSRGLSLLRGGEHLGENQYVLSGLLAPVEIRTGQHIDCLFFTSLAPRTIPAWIGEDACKAVAA
jgi:hypothetical protein